MRKLALSSLVALSLSGVAQAQNVLVYDHYSNVPNTNWFIPAAITTNPTGTTGGNVFMGGISLLAGVTGPTSLRGFDLSLVNSTGAAIPNTPGTTARLNFFIWNTIDTGTTSTVFSDLAGSGSVNLDLGARPTPLANNSVLFITAGATGPVGFPPLAGSPGVVFATPIAITDESIGFSFNWQLNTGPDGAFQNVNGLTTLITGSGATGAPTSVPPVVGTNGFALPNLGFFRSPDTSTDYAGNFNSTSSRSAGNNSGVMVRFYAIPEPTTLTLAAAAGAMVLRRKRKA